MLSLLLFFFIVKKKEYIFQFSVDLLVVLKACFCFKMISLTVWTPRSYWIFSAARVLKGASRPIKNDLIMVQKCTKGLLIAEGSEMFLLLKPRTLTSTQSCFNLTNYHENSGKRLSVHISSIFLLFERNTGHLICRKRT